MEQKRITPPDDLEVYDKRRPPRTEEPLVTVLSSGNFGYNPTSYSALGEPAAVEYTYSPKTGILGFRAADPEAPHTYPVYQQGNSRSFQSAGRSFHTYYGLPIGQAHRFKAELIGDTLYIDLQDDEAIPVGQRKAEG